MADLSSLNSLLWQVPDQQAAAKETPTPQRSSGTRTLSLHSGAAHSSATPAADASYSGTRTTKWPYSSPRVSVRLSSAKPFNATSTFTPAAPSASLGLAALPKASQSLDQDDGDGMSPAGGTALRFIALIVIAIAAVVFLCLLLRRRRRKASKTARERRSVTALRRDVELGRWRIPLLRHAGIGTVSQVVREDLPQYEGKAPAYPETVQAREDDGRQSFMSRASSRTTASLQSSHQTRGVETHGLRWAGAQSMEAVALSGLQHSDTDSLASR